MEPSGSVWLIPWAWDSGVELVVVGRHWPTDRAKRNRLLGYPIHMDGKLGERAKEVDEFAKQLVNRFGLVVSRVDERLTSVAAEESLGKKAKSKRAGKRKE